MTVDQRDFILALPKAELHLHIEGAVPWQIVRAGGDKLLPEVPPWWAKEFRFDDFGHFGQEMRSCWHHVLKDVEAYHNVAKQIFEDLVLQNVRYVEISCSAEHASLVGGSLETVIHAIKSAAPETIQVRVYAGFSRNKPQALDHDFLKQVFSASSLDGIDLHGDERYQSVRPYADLYAQARAHGLRTKAHAGELLGPISISETLDYLAVNRIEHGTTAMYDDELVSRLADEEITLDLCPSSNFKLRVVNDIQGHPIRSFYERGVRVTVNTDDPTLFGCSLVSELQLLVEQLGFSLADLAQLQANAFEVADISETERWAILHEIETLVMQTTPLPLAI